MDKNNKAIYQSLWDRIMRAIQWILNRNDIYMEKITKWLAEKFNLGLLPTQSRWGIVSILSSLALFFIALFPAIFAIHQASMEGNMKEALLILAGIFAALGFLLAIFTLALSTYFLRHQKEDVLIQSVNEVKTEVTKIHTDLQLLGELPLIKQELENIRQTIEKLVETMLESGKKKEE